MEKDAQEVRDILEAVSDTVPKLLIEITDALFNPEKTKEFGKSVAEFYKTMVDNGMPPDKAYELTQKFMESSSPGLLLSQAIGGMGGDNINIGNVSGKDDDDFGDDIEKKIQEKMKKKGLNIKID